MIRTGEEYRESIRDGREVWMNGERVDDVTAHSAFRPVVDVRARIYDMANDEATRALMSYEAPSTAARHATPCPTRAAPGASDPLSDCGSRMPARTGTTSGGWWTQGWTTWAASSS